MSKIEKLRNGALKIFGDIKVFKYPMFLLYDPGSYLITGEEMRQVINTIQPGDIVIRGYKNYLDGYFIPGFFSHAGLYVGSITNEDKQFLNPNADISLFKEGEQMVIHSMAEGVFMQDILNFCRCDYMVILRRNMAIESTSLAFDEVKKTAIEQLGKPYDFGFDFSDFHALSCTEFVYYCYENIMEAYGIKPIKRTVMFITKQIITPDDFVNDKFQLVWKNGKIPNKKLNKLINS